MAIAVQTLLERDGIEFLLKAKVLRVERSGNATKLLLQVAEREMELQGSHLLVAVGRTPNSDSLNLAAAGVATDARGFIPVNDRLETNVPNIWALGDINGGPQYTHVSLNDYRIVKFHSTAPEHNHPALGDLPRLPVQSRNFLRTW
jgi:pyruvate/2-oxoglutarate dehydrogenase complex dihydrolipoamide dehydrogenase (E3) component